MKKILTIVGARPQIIKAAALSRAIETEFSSALTQVIVHTGQHYQENMSAVFFEELGIPQPDYNLAVGSSSHAVQTAEIMKGIEKLIESENPDALLVYGDTNSTIAASLAASKMQIPVVHVEAGLRSFNKAMPEEINRVLCDHVSTLLFCPTVAGIENLQKEGFNITRQGKATIDAPVVYQCGDVMYDNSLYFSDRSAKESGILQTYKLVENEFILVTIHRNNNADEAARLNAIFSALLAVQEKTGLKIILPLHPRTKKMMDILLDEKISAKLDQISDQIIIIPPAGFLDIIALEKNARIIVTDSGGLQKEAFFFQKPCVILRPETEWIEIVENGNAILADADEQRITAAFMTLLEKQDYTYPAFFGDGKSAVFIAQKIIESLQE